MRLNSSLMRHPENWIGPSAGPARPVTRRVTCTLPMPQFLGDDMLLCRLELFSDIFTIKISNCTIYLGQSSFFKGKNGVPRQTNSGRYRGGGPQGGRGAAPGRPGE